MLSAYAFKILVINEYAWYTDSSEKNTARGDSTMYILTWIANCPTILEYHDKVQTLQLNDLNIALDAYARRKNNPIYHALKVEYYYNGSYTPMTQTFNDILKARGN